MRGFLLYFYLLASFFGMGQAIKFGKLGNGIDNNGYYTPVRAMFYDTIDKKLYVGGQFTQADGKTVWGAAVWYNNQWDSLRGGFAQTPQQTPLPSNFSNTVVWKITRFHNKIYFLGAMNYINGHGTCCMGVWNGTNWDPPITQVPNGFIYDLKVYNDTLYACGLFTKIGSTICKYVAKYDGTNWYPVGDLSAYMKTYSPAQMLTLEFYNNELYVGGAFNDSSGTSRNIAKFNGTQWVNVSTGIQQNSGYINTLQVFNNKLYIGGRFDRTAEIPGKCIVSWSGSSYDEVTSQDLQSAEVYFLKATKKRLIIFGNFTGFGNYPAHQLCYIDSNKVCAVSGLDTTYSRSSFIGIFAIDMINDSLIVGGLFTQLDTVNANSIGVITNYDSNPYCFITGIKTNTFENDFVKIYPNPFNDKLNLEITNDAITSVEVSITNSLGQLVYPADILKSKQTIDLSSLMTGIYFLKIRNTSGQKTFKVLKQ